MPVVGESKTERLSSDELAAIAAYGAKAEWPEGFAIYQRDASAEGLFIVLSGSVVLRTAKGKRKFIPAMVFAGETFGGEGLIPGASYATDANATEPAETLHINASRFRSLLREQPAVAMRIIAQAFIERAGLLRRIHEVCASSVDERLASALVRLHEGRSLGDDRLALRARDHRLLCEIVGATRESITHSLGRLVASGAATREDAGFVISRAKLLHDESERPSSFDTQMERSVELERAS